MKTFEDLFLTELSDIYDAEKRVVQALPKMIDAATSTALANALERHLAESEEHVNMVEQVFACFDATPKTKTCKATVGLLEEAEESAKSFKGSPAINAAIIAGVQKVEHYEMAAYGCLRAWAEEMGDAEAAEILQQILDEEGAADEALNKLACEGIHENAFSDPDEAEEDEESTGAKIVAGHNQ